MTIEAERETPSTQCTRTLAFLDSRNADLMKVIASGRVCSRFEVDVSLRGMMRCLIPSGSLGASDVVTMERT